MRSSFVSNLYSENINRRVERNTQKEEGKYSAMRVETCPRRPHLNSYFTISIFPRFYLKLKLDAERKLFAMRE